MRTARTNKRAPKAGLSLQVVEKVVLPYSNDNSPDYAALLRKIDSLERKIEQLQGIADFTATLERAIETELVNLREPVFSNPVTGRRASSLFAIFRALRYGNRLHWSIVADFMRANGGISVFFRTDLPKASSWATVCVDLEAVEDLLIAYQPRKAPKVINLFKEEHNVKLAA